MKNADRFLLAPTAGRQRHRQRHPPTGHTTLSLAHKISSIGSIKLKLKTVHVGHDQTAVRVRSRQFAVAVAVAVASCVAIIIVIIGPRASCPKLTCTRRWRRREEKMPERMRVRVRVVAAWSWRRRLRAAAINSIGVSIYTISNLAFCLSSARLNLAGSARLGAADFGSVGARFTMLP